MFEDWWYWQAISPRVLLYYWNSYVIVWIWIPVYMADFLLKPTIDHLCKRLSSSRLTWDMQWWSYNGNNEKQCKIRLGVTEWGGNHINILITFSCHGDISFLKIKYFSYSGFSFIQIFIRIRRQSSSLPLFPESPIVFPLSCFLHIHPTN